MNPAELRAIDFKHIWHPFTQAEVWFADDPVIVERAEGTRLFDCSGNSYLDGVSSLWCNVHGHSAPELLEVMHRQVDLLCHSTLLGLSHVPAIELSEKLISIVPEGLSRVFFADSGSTAVEAGLRICLEWWQKQGTPASKLKRRFASLRDAYHGDTLGAVGLGYMPAFHRDVAHSVIPAYRVVPPHIYRFVQGQSDEQAVETSIAGIRTLFKQSAGEIAAFIVEPIVQGAAGIWIHPPEFLTRLAEECLAHNVLLVIDEVATGFGKTGKMFAAEHANIKPDVLIVGKGLSGGYLPISAALTTEEIFQGFVAPVEELKTFYYGQTYAGNPLAAKVSAASLDLFSSSNLLETLKGRIEYLKQLLNEKISPLAHVDEVRSFGVMVGIELTSVPGKRVPYPLKSLAGIRVTQEARKLGVIIRPIGNVIILMPPLVMPEVELKVLVEVTAQAIEVALGR